MAGSRPQKTDVRSGDSFLPDFCTVRMVFAVVVTAQLLAVVLTLGAVDSLRAFPQELSLRSLLIQWIALSGAGLLCVTGPWLRRMRGSWGGFLAWLLLLLVTLVVCSIAQLFLAGGYNIPAFGDLVLKGLGISAVVSALILRYLYIQHCWRQQMVAESEARFQALQSRIRPHFLFNSMNTIANLTRSDPVLAEEVVQDLSDLFRASLSDAGRQSCLADELELARGYLRIEGQRLGSRLRVDWDLEPLPEEAPLPALVLQPLLENAVYHGIEPASEPGSISIVGRYRRRRVNLSIRNSLPHKTSGRHRNGNAMALENTRQRLQGFFDGQASLTVGEVEGEHQVRVVFPYPQEEQ